MQTRKISSPLSIVFFLSTAISAGIHYYLTQQHIDLKYGFGEGSAICNLSDFFNCSTAIVSTYSEIFGIPLAIFGIFTNLVILFFTLKVLVFKNSANTAKSASVALGFAVVAVVATLIMSSISLFVLHSLCPFCTMTYVLSFITFFTCYAIVKPNLKGFTPEIFKPLLLACVFVAVGSVAYGTMALKGFNSKDVQELFALQIQEWEKATPTPAELVEPLKFGPDMAKMKIVEYADFLCPHCRAAHSKLHMFAKAHPGAQIIFQSFPLDGCGGPPENPGLRCQLAMTALCAEQNGGKGWSAHDYLFHNQEQVAESGSITATIENLSKEIGADAAKIDACVKDPKTLELIKKQAEGGKKLGVEGTPTLFINDKKFKGPAHVPLLIQIYDKL